MRFAARCGKGGGSRSIFRERRMKSKTNVAVIGGGNQCRELLNRFEKHAFGVLHPAVVAVVDMGDNGPCVTKAEELGLFVTNDLREILHRKDIDLIIDLSGDKGVSDAILREKGESVHLIDDF
jgi:acetaldehyde dehydrogenase (acetylating)